MYALLRSWVILTKNSQRNRSKSISEQRNREIQLFPRISASCLSCCDSVLTSLFESKKTIPEEHCRE
jgi:hypothetical protein